MSDSLPSSVDRLGRRRFLRAAVAASLGAAGLRRLAVASAAPAPADAAASPGAAPALGALVPDPQHTFDLPPGFSYRVVSRAGETMSDGLRVPGAPDGMAAFPAREGKVLLVRNHELVSQQRGLGPFGPNNELLDRVPKDRVFDAGRDDGPCLGGTTTLLYDPAAGRVETQFLSLAGTARNCCGGPTPWGSWISCEEPTELDAPWYARPHGWNFEVPPADRPGLVEPLPLRAMGRFNHEAVAFDPRTGIAYETEDRADGLLYRFLPKERGRLSAGGKLQALALRDRKGADTRNWSRPEIAARAALAVAWVDLDEVESPRDDLRRRGHAAGAALFARGEGMAWGDALYFDCTSGGAARIGQVFRYVPSPHEGTPGEEREPGHLELFYESADASALDYPDNLSVAPWGDLVACEDGEGDQFLVGVTPAGATYRIGRNAIDDTELAGATFSPDGRVLFLNLYGPGLTLAITGPWPGAPQRLGAVASG
jgi:hypothetical protein